MLEVAAAVIERPDGEFLLAQRPAGKVYAGWWEFPGGKIDEGESPSVALARELHEELGIEVRRAHPWITRVHAYEHATVRLSFFRVRQWAGEPVPRENQAIRWQRLGEPMAEPMLPANAPVLAALALPFEYAITCAQTMGEAPMLARLGQRLGAGLRLLQVRERDMAPAAVAEFSARAVRLAHRHGTQVLVNSDAELARSVGADGVHLTSAQLMQLDARPKFRLIAASCHDRGELERAMQLGLDFAVLGPVNATRSHAGAALLGWERFAALARGASIPVYAIGGLGRKDLQAAWDAGAHGIAMISGAWDDVATR